MGVSSFPPASAVKGVNQRFTWFTPFSYSEFFRIAFDSVASTGLCFSFSIMC